jgi:MFS family permease
MRVRGLSSLALLLAAVVVERVAYFGGRTFLTLELHDQGLSTLSVGTTTAMLQGVVLLGMLVGGAAALGLGPRGTAVVGLLVSAAGHFAQAAGAPVVAGAGVVAFGAGMFRPCIFVAAAEVLAWDDESPAPPGPHRFAAVSAFAVVAQAAINVGSFLGPMMAGMLRNVSWRAVHAGGGAEMLLATLLAAGALVVGLPRRRPTIAAPEVGPYRAAPPPAPAVPVKAALGGVGILLAAEAVFTVGASMTSPPYEMLRTARLEWLFAITTLAAFVASICLFGLLLVATLQRWSLPPLYLYGAGLVVFGLGLGVIAAGSSSVAIYALGASVSGIGEAAAYGVPIAYAAIAVRGRTATLVVAGWSAVLVMVSTASSAFTYVDEVRTPLLLTCALLDLGIGAAMVVFARRLHQGFFDPPRPVR